MIDALAVLELHRKLIEIPSVSHDEKVIADFVEARLRATGAEVWRIENNVVASSGGAVRLLLNSHLDTVPPTEEWTKDPFRATVEPSPQERRPPGLHSTDTSGAGEGNPAPGAQVTSRNFTGLTEAGPPEARNKVIVIGLGSNDTKGSVAAMICAFETILKQGIEGLAIMLVQEEETGGRGTEVVWPHLRDELGWRPEGVVVGEPTELQVGISQNGLLILELTANGTACHAANAAALGVKNPIYTLAQDLSKINLLPFPVLPQPTVLSGGKTRNQVPGSASAILDIRTEPGLSHESWIQKIRESVESEVRVISSRLEPFACPPTARIVTTAISQIPDATTFSSRTMSDQVFFSGFNAIKFGPGVSARSHTADEFIFEDEVVAGADAYLAICKEFLS